MESLFKTATALLKSKLSILFGISVALGVLLIMPDATAGRLGLTTIRTTYLPYVSVPFFILASVTVVQCFVAAWRWVGEKIAAKRFEKEAKHRLGQLSAQEKQILCGYLMTDRRTQYFAVQDGVVQGLCHAGVIYLSSQVGNMNAEGFSFNIHDWAWDYLEEHKRLVTEGVPRNSEGAIILYQNRFNILRQSTF